MAGKGDSWRRGTDFDKYRDSPYWENRRKHSGERVKTVSGGDGNSTDCGTPPHCGEVETYQAHTQDGGSTPPTSK